MIEVICCMFMYVMQVNKQSDRLVYEICLVVVVKI